MNGRQFLDHDDILVANYSYRRMQAQLRKMRNTLDERRNNNTSQRSNAIVLQDHKKGILTAPGRIQVFDDIELSCQSKRPDAVRKQAMRIDHLVVGIDRCFVVLVPLAGRLFPL